MKLSNNFDSSEFECQGVECCNHSAPMDRVFIERLQRLRDAIGSSISVSSGFRCRTHNKSIGGAKNSYHALGLASDIKCSSLSVDNFAVIAKKHFKGVIIYPTWVHVDDRAKRYHGDKR